MFLRGYQIHAGLMNCTARKNRRTKNSTYTQLSVNARSLWLTHRGGGIGGREGGGGGGGCRGTQSGFLSWHTLYCPFPACLLKNAQL